MMRRLRLIFVLFALALGATVLLDGLSPFGRLALKLGFPATAEQLFGDAGWKGHAQYLQGRYAEAAETQRGAGPDGYFHRANAVGRDGRYLLAYQILDAHLYRIPGDAVARKNQQLFDKLAAVVGVGSKGPNSGMPYKTIEMATPELTALEIRNDSVRQRFSDREVLANRQWLTTLTDSPGAFLRLRIEAERERRERAGLHQPPMEVPW